MARPRKATQLVFDSLKSDQDEVKMTKIHHMVRGLARTSGVEGGPRAVAELDAEIQAWFDQGYKLFQAFYLGETPEFFQLMYILVKDE